MMSIWQCVDGKESFGPQLLDSPISALPGYVAKPLIFYTRSDV